MRLTRRLAGAVAVALWVAVLVLGGLLVAGFRPATDRSNSMAPFIHRGDVLFSRQVLASSVRVGDVITFPDPYVKGVLLTHRVRQERLIGGRLIAFTTRGDANTGSEHWTIVADGRLTRFAFAIPKIGLVLITVDSHPLYLVAAIVFVLWLVLMAALWGPKPARNSGGRRARPPTRRRRRRGRLLVFAVVSLAAPAIGATVVGAAGSVAAIAVSPPAASLAINDEGQPLFDIHAMTRGDVVTACELVSNKGPGTVNVGTYAAIAGTGLARYLDLAITRGTLPAGSAPRSCAGFTADNARYGGSGRGVIYNGALDGFPNSADQSLEDPVSDWAAGVSVAYKMTVKLAGGNAAQGLAASAWFFFGANVSAARSTTNSTATAARGGQSSARQSGQPSVRRSKPRLAA